MVKKLPNIVHDNYLKVEVPGAEMEIISRRRRMGSFGELDAVDTPKSATNLKVEFPYVPNEKMEEICKGLEKDVLNGADLFEELDAVGTPENLRERVKLLARLTPDMFEIFASAKYFVSDIPEIPEAELEKLYHELKKSYDPTKSFSGKRIILS